MGIVRRQGIKHSIVNGIGVAIGAINILFIYPLAIEEYGLMRFLIDTATLLVPFVFLGFNTLTVRFFPKFDDLGKGRGGFLFLLLLGTFLGFCLFALLATLFRGSILTAFEDSSPLLQEYLFFIIPITFFLLFITLFTQYSSNFQRIVVPAILNIGIKIALPTLILLYVWNRIEIRGIVQGVVVNYVIVLVALIGYIYYLGQLKIRPSFRFLKKPLVKEMAVYAFFGILGSIGSVLALRIDTFMISYFLELYDTGIYGITAFIANVISIPMLAIITIVSPIVARAWHKEDKAEINTLYRKSSINMLIPGLLLFLGIWLCLDDLYQIVPADKGQELRQGQYIILMLGFGKLIDMATGVNSQIIGYSKYFRFNFYAILIMAAFNIVCNWIFIPMFQINGAALATLLSLALFNTAKLIYIYFRIGMQPFTSSTFKLLLIAVGVYAIASLLPPLPHPLLNIPFKAVVISALFVIPVLYFNISEDFTNLAQMVWGKVMGWWKG